MKFMAAIAVAVMLLTGGLASAAYAPSVVAHLAIHARSTSLPGYTLFTATSNGNYRVSTNLMVRGPLCSTHTDGNAACVRPLIYYYDDHNISHQGDIARFYAAGPPPLNYFYTPAEAPVWTGSAANIAGGFGFVLIPEVQIIRVFGGSSVGLQIVTADPCLSYDLFITVERL